MMRIESKVLQVAFAAHAAIDAEAGTRRVVARDLRIRRSGSVIHLEIAGYLQDNGPRLTRYAQVVVEAGDDED
jgi:hypothetical protein